MKPGWKSLACAVQLLMILDFWFVLLARGAVIGEAAWRFAIGITAALVILVSILAVRR